VRARAILIAALLALPAPASAATTQVMRDTTAHFFEPALAGDRVVVV
jgi:hypothetical protein